MKRVLLLALAIATPAYAQDMEEMTAEQHGALANYFTCFYQQAAATDDGLVDASSLARSFAPKCRPLLDRAVTLFSQGKPSSERDALHKKWIGLEELQATRTVWALREDRENGIIRNVDVAVAPAATAPAPMQFASAAPPAAKPVAARPKSTTAVAAGSDGKPMSEWRRAYIAKHGREPPAPK